jgi:hypothetical protein
LRPHGGEHGDHHNYYAGQIHALEQIACHRSAPLFVWLSQFAIHPRCHHAPLRRPEPSRGIPCDPPYTPSALCFRQLLVSRYTTCEGSQQPKSGVVVQVCVLDHVNMAG